MKKFEITCSIDGSTLREDHFREVLVDERVTFGSAGVPLATDNPLEVVIEPQRGAAVLDGATFTATLPGVYSLRCRNALGVARRINCVAWEPAALDWLERGEAAHTGPGYARSRAELRQILRSLSNDQRTKLTGLVADLPNRDLARFGART